ncbi:PilN domain-containing protein [Dongshaea marina]|uniref:PilN domain-containing protein n=1 Tax=Dongshaea marina TaxID=2047966 RepID=UPI000D3E1301|nr:PilN domain-containing protein [Dongshaea marina]
MKTRINLYPSELRPRRQWGTLPQMVLVWGVLLILMAGCYSGIWFMERQQAANNRQLSQQLSSLQQQLGEQTKQLKDRHPSKQLQQRVKLLQEELLAKRGLMTNLHGRDQELKGQFADLLYALGRLKQPSIWLQRILMQGQVIELEGMTQESRALPLWIAEFSQYPVLAQQSFASITLGADKGAMRFMLVSQLKMLQGQGQGPQQGVQE